MSENIEKPTVQGKRDGAEIMLRVVPRASKTEMSLGAGGLRVRVAAPPVDGAANRELIRFFSKRFRIAKSLIKIVSGEKGKTKRLLFEGLSPQELNRLIQDALSTEV